MGRHGNYRGGMKFGAPIWSPESKVTVLCYPSHAIGRVFRQPYNLPLRIAAIDIARTVRWEDAWFDIFLDLHCASLVDDRSWRQLGWVMADGSLPHGELQKVDPFMAQFDHLPLCDTTKVDQRTPFQLGD